MIKKVLLLLLLFPCFFMNAQAVVDTNKVYKEYPKDLPTIAFDSARISPDGRYALVLNGDNLNGCWVNYWKLHQKGNEKPIEEFIIIREDKAYVLDYENGQIKDGLTIVQNGKTHSWDLSRIMPIDDLIKRYDLTVKPQNNTKKLNVVFDTLSPVPIKISAEFSKETVGKTETRLAQRIEAKFYYRDKLLHTSQISYLPDDDSNTISDIDFNNYLDTIKKQIQEQPVGRDYGLLFLISGTDYLLSFNVESWIFSGYRYSEYTGGQLTHQFLNSGSGSSPGASFEILQSFKH